MKRPEGFDRQPASRPEPQPRRRAGTPKPSAAADRAPKARAPKARAPKAKAPRANAPKTHSPERERVPTDPTAQAWPRRKQNSPASASAGVGAAKPLVAEADRELKKAARSRRRYERTEVRRFTRRSRQRRVTWLVGVLSLAVMAALVTGAVYSPLLSLTTITVEGASRVSAASVRAAVGPQLGMPLALLDFGKITRSLSKFPLIRSFVTEIVPPNTLVIRIAERAPIGTVLTPAGFIVVDPAGVVIDTVPDRPPGLPLIELGTASKDSVAFTAAVAVLLALPANLLPQVDTVSALTKDNVMFVLTGVGQSVVWGSAEQSALKARVLAELVKLQDPGTAVTFDVSAPTRPVVGPG